MTGPYWYDLFGMDRPISEARGSGLKSLDRCKTLLKVLVGKVQGSLSCSQYNSAQMTLFAVINGSILLRPIYTCMMLIHSVNYTYMSAVLFYGHSRLGIVLPSPT